MEGGFERKRAKWKGLCRVSEHRVRTGVRAWLPSRMVCVLGVGGRGEAMVGVEKMGGAVLTRTFRHGLVVRVDATIHLIVRVGCGCDECRDRAPPHPHQSCGFSSP